MKEQLFNLIFCRLIFSVRDVSVALESFEFSLTVGDRVVVRHRGKPACTWRFCLVSSQGRPALLDVTFQIGNEVVELLVVFICERGFQLRVRQRRGIDELLACCLALQQRSHLESRLATVGRFYSDITASESHFHFVKLYM